VLLATTNRALFCDINGSGDWQQVVAVDAYALQCHWACLGMSVLEPPLYLYYSTDCVVK